MISDGSSEAARGESSPSLREDGAPVNPFTAADVAAILRERGWLNAADVTVTRVFRPEELALQIPASEDATNKQDLEVWLEDAAAWLGPHAADGSTSLTASRDALGELLSLIFLYDAETILQRPESHVLLAREGAREVLRELAHCVLDGPEVNSERFKEIVTALKEKLRYRSRELFQPIRLALAGRAGEGELDRVILLLDRAARLPSCTPVKGVRQRMLEFCAAVE
jgi:glutamyl/glutaminyl-tRNA synthetase